MLLEKNDYERCLRGFTVTDCTIRSRSIFYLIAMSDYEVDEDHEPPSNSERTTRVIAYFLEKPRDKRWNFISYQGLARLNGGAVQKPREQFVGVDLQGTPVVLGSGVQEIEQDIPTGKQGPRRGAVMRTRTIDGVLHVATGNRGLARRDERNNWTSLCANLVFEPDPEAEPDEYGFGDVDAFDSQDFYCVGGRGDVWHFDGKKWKRLAFPSNMALESVCCAGDGWVYIGGASGAVWKGRGDEWRLIHRDRMVLPFKDICWFQDRVYCTSDYGLWELVGDELRECDVPPEIKICSGNLSVADGVMLLAGAYGAAYHDGRSWKHIFDTAAFSPRTL